MPGALQPRHASDTAPNPLASQGPPVGVLYSLGSCDFPTGEVVPTMLPVVVFLVLVTVACVLLWQGGILMAGLSASPFTAVAWCALLACAVVLLVRALMEFRRTLPKDGPGKASLVATIYVMCSLLATYYVAYGLPYCLEGNPMGAIRGIFESAYNILLSVGMQADVGGTVDAAAEALGAGDATGAAAVLVSVLTNAYAILLVTLCFAAPLTAATAAFTHFRELLRNWQYVLMRMGHRDVYLVTGLGDPAFSLASDVLRTFQGQEGNQPLVMMCGVSGTERDEHSELVESLEDEGRGNVLLTPRSPSDVLGDLERDRTVMFYTFRHRFDHVYCLLLDDDCAKNVESAIDVIETITASALQGVDVRDDQQVEAARAEAARFSVYCMHDNPENELVFDSLVHGESGDGPKDDDARQQLAAIRKVRLSMEVRLISRAREQAYDLLTRHPLFGVLDRPIFDEDAFAEQFMRMGTDEGAMQKLYVIVAGLGSYGLEVLKTAYWIGRMRGVEMRIWGIDQRGNAIGDLLGSTCPEMMSEEVATSKAAIASPASSEAPSPEAEAPSQESGNTTLMGEERQEADKVVTIFEAEAFSGLFEDIVRSVPHDARIYAVVTMGDDQLNLNVALSLRRIFDDMLRRRELDPPIDEDGNRAEYPMILPLVNSPEIFRAADRMTSDRNEAFRLEPFGMTREVFSYHNIIDEPWERYALAMNAAYREVWDENRGWPEDQKDQVDQSLHRGVDARVLRSAVVEEYADYEIKKLSNRTNVRHIPYRLWCLGIDPREVFGPEGDLVGEGLDMGRWMRILSFDADGANELLTPHTGVVANEVTGTKARLNSVMRDEQDKLRTAFPVVCALAALEHERWMAFYRSQGWRGMTIDECRELARLGIVAKWQVHQSPKLRLHCYICSNEELLARGIELADDPYAYDRAAVIETPRILDGSIFA